MTILKREVVWGLMLAASLRSNCLAADVAGRLKDLNFSIFAMAGGSTLFDSMYFTSADEKYHSRYDVGEKFVIGTGVPIGKIFAIETSYTWGPNNLVVTNTSLFPHTSLVYPVRYHSLSISAVVLAPGGPLGFRPFAMVGWDYTRFAPTLEANVVANNQGFGAVSTAQLSDSTKVGLSGGVGIEHKLVGKLNFRLEVRDHFASSPNFGLPASGTSTAIFPVSGYAHNVAYTAGLIYRFGKKYK